jgi:glycopeptide antibiotics resistance protein
MTLGLLLLGSVVVWLLPARYRFWAWIVVIAAVVTPWRGLQDHGHWSRVRWVPFISPPVRIRDILGNVMLYVPYGFLHAKRRQTPSALWVGATQAALLSVCTEFTQVFSHDRFPSVQDVLMNVVGAVIGMALVGVTPSSTRLAVGDAERLPDSSVRGSQRPPP